MRIAIDICLGISLFFCLIGVLGILRMPDSLSRMQASTTITTMGILGVMIAAILYSAVVLKNYAMVVKLAVMAVFYLITTPVSSHAIARAAYRHGTVGPKDLVCDQYGEDLEHED